MFVTCRTDEAMALLVEDDKSISYLVFNFLVINLPGKKWQTRCNYEAATNLVISQTNSLKLI